MVRWAMVGTKDNAFSVPKTERLTLLQNQKLIELCLKLGNRHGLFWYKTYIMAFEVHQKIVIQTVEFIC